MNKNSFAAENVLVLKDATKQYQVGVKSSILKWRYVTKDDSALPISSMLRNNQILF